MARATAAQKGHNDVMSVKLPKNPRDIMKAKLSTPAPLLPSRRAMQNECQDKMEYKDKKNNALSEIVNLLNDSGQCNDTLSESAAVTTTTNKKGILWQQQNFDKFHRRLFNRWKKRYFILTTDYLACFSKTSSKVGHSEMGKFIYKISLGDVRKIEWVYPKKSDKGAIILQIDGNFNLSLWSKRGLDDWMNELTDTWRLSNSKRPQLSTNNDHPVSSEGVYDNTNIGMIQQHNNALEAADDGGDSETQLRLQQQDMTSVGSDHRGENKNSRPNEPAMSSSPAMINERSCSNDMPPVLELQQKSNSTCDRESTVVTTEGRRDDNVKLNSKVTMLSSEQKTDFKGHNPDGGSDSRLEAKESEPDGIEPCNNAVVSNKLAEQISCEQVKQGNECGSDGIGSALDVVQNVESSIHKDKAPVQHPIETNKMLAQAAAAAATNMDRPNLMRRDDSWQSLVSLTRVGLDPMQVRTGNLEQMMPRARRHEQRERIPTDNDAESRLKERLDRQRRINIESTITPLRGPSSMLRRQQSLQVARPEIQKQWHANSFDSPANNQNGLGINGQPPSNVMTSYHDKLLQLQMLHNNSNSDYLRHNNEIYGPESVATNHYGYYSMRSNLKSAASEFSFVRPSSSGLQSIRQQQELDDRMAPRMALPHQFSSYMLHSPITNQPHHGMVQTTLNQNRMSFAAPAASSNGMVLTRMPDQNNNLLVSVPTAESNALNNEMALRGMALNEIYGGNVNQITLAELAAPTRQLPLKPNKRRTNGGRDGDFSQRKPSTTTITSNIAGFFRRAFSRRSTRNNNKKSKKKNLAKSCSSSMGAFDEESFPNVPLIQSAFSTGSKSVNQTNTCNSNTSMPPQKMIDMIQAFANKTILDQNYRQQNALGLNGESFIARDRQGLSFHNESRQQLVPTSPHPHISRQQPSPSLPSSEDVVRNIVGVGNDHLSQTKFYSRGKQFGGSGGGGGGSLLNKSSSIGATMAFSGHLNEDLPEFAEINGEAYQHHHQPRDMAAASRRSNKDKLLSQLEASNSPQVLRSTRVMSANLTPLFSRGDLQLQHHQLQQQQNELQLGLSPRGSRGDSTGSAILPRPSSIYGQPSMISSPGSGSNFGQHRNSMNAGRVSSASYQFHRRSQIVRASILDTTREISEEATTPTVEDDDADVDIDIDDNIRRHRMGALNEAASMALYQRHAAVVNPILHSSTIKTIYDNCPLAELGDGRTMNDLASGNFYSHYDNQHPKQTRMAEFARSNSSRFGARQSHGIQEQGDHFFLVNELEPPPRPASVRSVADHARIQNSQMMIYNKPAAIVAPRTPNRSMLVNCTPTRDSLNHFERSRDTRNSARFQIGHQLLASSCASNGVAAASVSPMASRRAIGVNHASISNSQSYYSYSPLVSQQTRLLRKHDGTQATVIDGNQAFSGDYAQPIIDNSGPSRINPEALIVRDASVIYDRDPAANSGVDRAIGPRTYQLTSSSNGTANNSFNGVCQNLISAQCQSALSRDGLASTSRSDNSSCGRTSSSTLFSNKSDSNRQQSGNGFEPQKKNSKKESLSSKRRSSRKRPEEDPSKSSGASSSQSTQRRSLSFEKSNGSSSHDDSIDLPDEKNWVVSKLVH